MGDALGVEEGARAEEVVAGRGRAAILDQLGSCGRVAHPSRSAAAARKSSGETAQISRSKRSPASLVVVLEGFDVAPAEAGDRALRGFVEGGDLAVDAVGAELVEGRGDRQRLGPAADPAAPHLVADQGAQLGAALAREAVERGEADRLGVPLDEDRVLAVLARVVHRPSDPVLGFLGREALPLDDQGPGRPLVVEPAVDGGGVAGLEAPQADLGGLAHRVRPRGSAVSRRSSQRTRSSIPASRQALSTSARPWRKCFQPS